MRLAMERRALSRGLLSPIEGGIAGFALFLASDFLSAEWWSRLSTFSPMSPMLVAIGLLGVAAVLYALSRRRQAPWMASTLVALMVCGFVMKGPSDFEADLLRAGDITAVIERGARVPSTAVLTGTVVAVSVLVQFRQRWSRLH